MYKQGQLGPKSFLRRYKFKQIANLTIKHSQDIADEITKNSGEAYVMRATLVNESSSDAITKVFCRERDEEYRELLGKCEDFSYICCRFALCRRHIYADIWRIKDEPEGTGKKTQIDIPAVFITMKKKETPVGAKIIAGLTVAYDLSPIDLIPDFIPI
jgi:hypothetical protein